MLKQLKRWKRRHDLQYAFFRLQNGELDSFSFIEKVLQLMDRLTVDAFPASALANYDLEVNFISASSFLKAIDEAMVNYKKQSKIKYTYSLLLPESGKVKLEQWLLKPLRLDCLTYSEYFLKLKDDLTALLGLLKPALVTQYNYVDRSLKPFRRCLEALIELFILIEVSYG